MREKRIVYFILAAFITGTILLVFIQYNSAKNINALISGNEKLLNEFNVSNELKELETDVISIESRIRGAVSINDSTMIDGLALKTAEIRDDLAKLQAITDDDSSIRYIDQLENIVNLKLEFSQKIIDSFRISGKVAAERVIRTKKGVVLTAGITDLVTKADRSRKKLLREVTMTIDASGKKALRFSLILIIFVLLSAAMLFWYIINIIQKQRQLIADLNESEKQVRATAKIKENFLANMSHEIRTPLNAILGFTNLLQRSNDAEKSASYIKTIQSSGENLLNIINDILDLSKIEAGMLRIESTVFSIRSLLDSVDQMFRSRAAEKHLSLYSSVDADVPDYLEGDPTRLTQILVNLIGNAIKFTNDGSVTVKFMSKGFTEDGKVSILLSVTDTGIGVSKSKLKGIFERFEQGDADVTRKFGGTGLGLSIVRDLVSLQHGEVDVESEEGKGTTFYVTIPYVIPVNYDQTGIDAASNKAERKSLGNVRLLIAEDNEINQRLLRHLFDEWQVQYEIRNNGKEAVDALRSASYDIVMLDIQMPVMDGYTATEVIRQVLGLDVPIIAMTAHAMAGEKEKCISYGMTDYLSKPIRENLLQAMIEKYAPRQKAIAEKENVPQISIPTGYKLIDLSYLRDLSLGDKNFETEITKQFIESLNQDLTGLNSAQLSGDIKSMKKIAHNMKTTISVMGLNSNFNPVLDELEHNQLSEDQMKDNIAKINAMSAVALEEAATFAKTLS